MLRGIYIYAVVVCLSVRHKPVLYRKEWKNRTGGFLPPITHCANWDISKDEAIPVWNLVSNSGLGKFRHGKSVALSSKLDVVVDGRVCWRHLYDSRRVVAVYYTSINCNPPLLRFAVDLLYKMLTGTARRAVRLRVLLVHCTHTHTFNGPFPGLPRWAGTRKVKPIWILLKQETVSGSGIRARPYASLHLAPDR